MGAKPKPKRTRSPGGLVPARWAHKNHILRKWLDPSGWVYPPEKCHISRSKRSLLDGVFFFFAVSVSEAFRAGRHSEQSQFGWEVGTSDMAVSQVDIPYYTGINQGARVLAHTGTCCRRVALTAGVTTY